MEPYRLLLLSEGGCWVVQCLDFDIVGQGDSVEDAVVDFVHTFIGEIALAQKKGKAGLSDVPPAPDYYWRLFRGVAQPIESCTIDNKPIDVDISIIPQPFMLPDNGLRCVVDHVAM